jgi:hypothetical protein
VFAGTGHLGFGKLGRSFACIGGRSRREIPLAVDSFQRINVSRNRNFLFCRKDRSVVVDFNIDEADDVDDSLFVEVRIPKFELCFGSDLLGRSVVEVG